jgi:hypothetical protein
MVLQIAAVALQVAAMIMKVSGMIPVGQHGGVMPWTGLAYLHAGERVLTPEQRRAWDSGVGQGGGQSNNVHINIDARGAQKGIDWKKITRDQIAPEVSKQIKLGRIRVG